MNYSKNHLEIKWQNDSFIRIPIRKDQSDRQEHHSLTSYWLHDRRKTVERIQTMSDDNKVFNCHCRDLSKE
jgi:hypothetical protein